MDTSLSCECSGVPESEFAAIMDRVTEMCHDIVMRCIEIAKDLGRLSRAQLAAAKKRLTFLGHDRIDRLALCGRGIVPEWVALRERCIQASVIRRSEPIRRALQDPNRPVMVLTMRQPLTKRLCELSYMELMQVLDEQKGILSLEDQKDRLMRMTGRLSRKDREKEEQIDKNMDLFDGMKVVGGMVCFYARRNGDKPGTRTFAVGVPMDTIRGLFGRARMDKCPQCGYTPPQ